MRVALREHVEVQHPMGDPGVRQLGERRALVALVVLHQPEQARAIEQGVAPQALMLFEQRQ